MIRIFCAILFVYSYVLVVNATDWNYNLGKVTSGQVILKDKNGNVVNINANSLTGSVLSTAPLVVTDGGGGYNFTFAFKLSNGDTYLYDDTLGNWIAISNADFDAKFTYSTTPLSLMARDFVSKTNRHNVTIVGECGNEQWHIATGNECTANCISNSAGTMVYGSYSEYENNKDLHWISDWHNDDKNICEVSSYSGYADGVWSFGGWVSWRFYADTRVAFPYGFGGIVEASSVRTGYEYSGSDPYGVKTVNVSKPTYTQASVEATGHYVRLNGVNRYLAFGDSNAGGGNHTYTTRMLRADGVTVQIIPPGNHSILENGDAYAASGEPFYIVQASNGDIYSIDDNKMTLIVSGVVASPVSLVNSIVLK